MQRLRNPRGSNLPLASGFGKLDAAPGDRVGTLAFVLRLHQFVAANRPRLLCFRRRVGKDGRHAVRIDVESQEG
jgi:hypothetical protein